jgi:hypothetical protein
LALFALAFRKNQAPPVAFQTTEQDSEWIENNELTDNAKEKFSATVEVNSAATDLSGKARSYRGY